MKRFWQRPEAWLYLIAAYLPLSYRVIERTGRLGLLMTGVLFALAARAHFRRQRSLGLPATRWTPLVGIVALFAGLSVVSLLRAGAIYGLGYLPSQITELIGWLLPMALFFLTLWIVQDARTLKRLCALMMGMVILVALHAMREYLSQADDNFEASRVAGLTEDPNRLGAFFVSYLFLFLGFFLVYFPRRLSYLMAIPLLLSLRGVMVTFSRGAYLAAVAGGLVTSWFRHKALFLLLVGLGLGAIAYPGLLPGGVRYRLEMTFVRDPDAPTPSVGGKLARILETSAAERLEIWDASLRIVRDHPGWGVGFGAFPRFLKQYASVMPAFLDAHNVFLMLAAEMGIFAGLIFLGILLGVGFHAAWLARYAEDKALKAIGLGMLGGLAGLTTANLFSYCFGTLEVSGYFWILCGLILRAVLLEKEALASVPETASVLRASPVLQTATESQAGIASPGKLAARLPRAVSMRVLISGMVLAGGFLGFRHVESRYPWLWSYLSDRWLTSPAQAASGPTHILFTFVDHFEPHDAKTMERWMEGYPRLAQKHRDADGRPPQHTWFWYFEHADKEETLKFLRALAQLTYEGYGEVELHLHHFADTPETFVDKMQEAISLSQKTGAFLTAEKSPRTAFGFIHGMWALDNSRPEACGVNNELLLLSRLGCYADFTHPSWGPMHPRMVNRLYYATDDPKRPKSYDRGLPMQVGRFPKGDLLIFEGPSVVRWKGFRPWYDHGDVTREELPTPERIDDWIGARIHVQGRPDWVFVKVFTHGALAVDEEAVLGEWADRMYRYLEERYNDGENYVLHYVTAREAYNIAKAAEAGKNGNPHRFRDFEIPDYVNRFFFASSPYQVLSMSEEKVVVRFLEPRGTRVWVRLRGGQVRIFGDAADLSKGSLSGDTALIFTLTGEGMVEFLTS